MANTERALRYVTAEIGKQETRAPLSFEEYLELILQDPQKMLRNIFQLFYDLVQGYVKAGVDEYPDDPESIGFISYVCSKLFVDSMDHPFFADRLFANRFVHQIETLRQGFQQNRIYAYDGPSGCGKSTFLNNLLRAFEIYTRSEEGRAFEIVWEIEKDFLIPCPSHDYPLLVVPKEYRVGFLEKLFLGIEETASALLKEKQYEWIFRNDVCTICRSIFWSAFEKSRKIEDVLGMIKARPRRFDRRMGEGISIFNPGDGSVFGTAEDHDKKSAVVYFTSPPIQEALDRAFGLHAVRYIYSHLAKTNNGIYVLMDIKGHNRARLLELHNVISEGVHKVSDMEEPITSLFIALMNPEDKDIIEEEKMESFKGRIYYNKIPYVLEPATEIEIYLSTFGKSVKATFLPRIIENFVKVIIASRMKKEYPNSAKNPLKEWIPDITPYKRYCDKYGLLLRMEIYSGVIPSWLSEEDKKKFTAPIRRLLISAGENEGDRGFSGRDSLRLFNDFFNRYKGRSTLINMNNILEFFKHRIGKEVRDEYIPEDFLASLTDSYDYTVLSEIKESLYFYNESQIAEDVLHYLWAIDYDVGTKRLCPHTGKEVEVTMDFLKLMAMRLAGKEMTDSQAERFTQEIQKKSVTVRAREGSSFKDMELYRDMVVNYRTNLKENVLQPFVNNENFREAVKAFGAPEFGTFDGRLREHVVHMIHALTTKLGYTEQGAKEICLYVLDKDLTSKFA